MGGVYENDYVKENGVWKIKRDQVFNTYFVPYTVGWKDVQPRPPPGYHGRESAGRAADASRSRCIRARSCRRSTTRIR